MVPLQYLSVPGQIPTGVIGSDLGSIVSSGRSWSRCQAQVGAGYVSVALVAAGPGGAVLGFEYEPPVGFVAVEVVGELL